MKKFLTVVLFALGLVVALAAPTYAVAQEDAILTDYDYSRLSFGNAFANQKAKPILRNADRAIHAPVSTLALLASIEYGARYQGMMVNVDTGLYFYDATDCPGGSTSPTAVAPDDTVGCWYLMSGAADIWAALADTTPTSGASLIGIKDTATYYTGTTVETALAEVGAEFLTKQDLAVPAAIGNIATLDATGQVVDSGDLLSEYAKLIGTPTNGNFACTDALGQPVDCGSAPADYLTIAAATVIFDSAGLGVPMVDAALAGADVPVAPADGYRVFVTAAGGAFVEGKTYQYTVGTGYTGGVSLDDGYILQVKGTAPDFIIGGTALTDWVRLSDFATDTDLNTRITTIADTAADTAPADPGIDGYRVFMTNTDGGLDEGKIYVWDDTGNAWDAGTLLANGQMLAIKGAVPDIAVGGTAATNYVMLSDKGPSPECQNITVGLGANSGTSAANPDWIGATIHSYVPVSGNDQPVASIAVAGDGAVTVTTSAVETAEAVFRVCSWIE